MCGEISTFHDVVGKLELYTRRTCTDCLFCCTSGDIYHPQNLWRIFQQLALKLQIVLLWTFPTLLSVEGIICV